MFANAGMNQFLPVILLLVVQGSGYLIGGTAVALLVGRRRLRADREGIVGVGSAGDDG